MSLLDDARRLVSAGEPTYYSESEKRLCCTFCVGVEGEGQGTDVTHEPDCAWLSMPRIVAALESAERMAMAHEQQSYPGYWSEMQKAVLAYREAAGA